MQYRGASIYTHVMPAGHLCFFFFPPQHCIAHPLRSCSCCRPVSVCSALFVVVAVVEVRMMMVTCKLVQKYAAAG